jgi:hypothetical protein
MYEYVYVLIPRVPAEAVDGQLAAYVSIRQHTSAYVSIRQHVYEYVDVVIRRVPAEAVDGQLDPAVCCLLA